METNLETLRNEHEELAKEKEKYEQPKEENAPLQRDPLPKVETFIQKVQSAGESVEDNLTRNLLRSYLQYWGSYVYERKGVYPNVELKPFTQITSSNKRQVITRVLLLTVVVLVLSIIGVKTLPLVLQYLSAREPPKVEILQPRDQDSVPYETEVSGRYEGDLAEQNLWVIVRPRGSDQYYPQQPAKIQKDKSWFVMARFGQDTPEENGKAFDIFVYLASNQTDQKLQKYVTDAEEKGEWLGMPLPNGLTQLDQVRVTRQIPLMKAQILQPRDQDLVPYEMEVSGRYEGDLAEQNLWVIVRPQGSGLYYPQQPAKDQGNNTWSVIASFGKDSPEENGKVFNISIYLANGQADQKLKEYINEADTTNNWLGMPSLVDGLTLLDWVTVVRGEP